MRKRITCQPSVLAAINETNARLDSSWQISEEKRAPWAARMALMDTWARELHGEAFAAEVKGDMTIAVTADIPEVIIETNDGAFYELAEQALAINFSALEDDDVLKVTFLFPGIWEQRTA